MDFITTDLSIRGTAALSQSHKHDEPKLDGESADDYDKRTWRSKCNFEVVDGRKEMVIPSSAMAFALSDAAGYLKKKIEGKGQSTWTAKFRSGISVLSNGRLGVSVDDVQPIVIQAHADGKRTSGSRVTRRFPQIPAGWTAEFEILIFDPIITQEIFHEVARAAGLFIGLGQYRPQKGGSNGRFNIEGLLWNDNRRALKRAA